MPSVRIVAPIPGKTTVGIEVPNDHRNVVRLGDVDRRRGASDSTKCRIPLFLGKDVKGKPLVFDLADMPHLLIAGRTGTGKSVCLNAMILSILMTRRPDEVKMILIDPKMVELSQYKRIPHLMHPVVTDMKKAESLLAWACEKMDERYEFLAGPRSGTSSVQPAGRRRDLRAARPRGRRGAAADPDPHAVHRDRGRRDGRPDDDRGQGGRAAHRPPGAERPGRGHPPDPGDPEADRRRHHRPDQGEPAGADRVPGRQPERLPRRARRDGRRPAAGQRRHALPDPRHLAHHPRQGTYVSDDEVTRISQYLERYPVEFSRELVQLQVGGGPGGKDRGAALKERDELYEPAIEIVIREGRGSCSLLQRALGIGYGRAARLIDFMAEDGIVGEYKSGSAREVLYTWEEWEALKNGGAVKGDAEK